MVTHRAQAQHTSFGAPPAVETHSRVWLLTEEAGESTADLQDEDEEGRLVWS